MDNHQPFLDQLKYSAEKEGVSNQINIVQGDMCKLNYKPKSFNVIWSEGAIFIIGFEKGLREWRRLLADKGYIVVSELSWLRADLPKEIRSFMEEGYLGYVDIKTIDENLEVAQKIGYNIVGSFVLPKKSWWDGYYAVKEAKMPLLKATHQDDADALRFIAYEETEIAMFRQYSDYYGNAFCILQNT